MPRSQKQIKLKKSDCSCLRVIRYRGHKFKKCWRWSHFRGNAENE